MISSECDVVSLYVMCCSINVSVSLCVACLTVFVNCLVKQFAMCLGVDAILLLNVMDGLVCVVELCWIDQVWSSKECVCGLCL